MFSKENIVKENKMERNTLAGLGIGLLAGAVIGGAIALLYVPKSGKETRAWIGQTASDLKEKGSDLKERATDLKNCVTAGVSGNGGSEQTR